MDKNLSAKKYFIYAFKNYLSNDNKILAKKCMPSIRELLHDYIEIYEDINKTSEQSKLKRARDELLVAINFFIRKSIFYEEGIYKDELISLTKQIHKVKSLSKTKKSLQYTKIYHSFRSLIKKINNDNIYCILIELVKQYEHYYKVDKTIELFLSELIYDNFSLKSLDEWYNDNIGRQEITDDKIDGILNKFKDLKAESKTYSYYFSLYNKKNRSKIKINHNMELKRIEYQGLNLYEENKKTNLKNFLQYSDDYDIFKIEFCTRDVYNGLEKIVSSIKSYFQIINYLNSNNKNIVQDKVVVKIDEDYKKIRIKVNDDTILFSSIEEKERQDMEDFIKYRDNVYAKKIKSKEINNLQRALNIVKGQKNQLKENRLINLWAVIEYLLTFYEGVSIISKAKDIIPKLVSLYILKDNLNVFWSRLYKYKDRNISIVDEFINECVREGHEYYYDVNKITKFIQDKGESLIDEFEFNDILRKNIAQIGMHLNHSNNRFEYIKNKHDEITHDLVRIYRTRNILIHSGNNTKTNLDYKSLRLYRYNNSLLGVIIYYKNKNLYSTITEILNSINYTYDNYLETLKNEDAALKEIIKPSYLFIG